MTVLRTCDVLVIGAGPAGSSAAGSAAEAGAKVILLEARERVGIPVRCAEYVPAQVFQGRALPREVISQPVDRMRTHMPDGEVLETPGKGFLIHRDLFDQHLAEGAVRKGVEIVRGRARQYREGVVLCSTKGDDLEIEARVIVGADGPHSTAGKWIDSRNRDFIHTAQHRMPLLRDLDTTEVYFRRDIPGGYGWVFPKGRVANVGVGVGARFKVRPAAALKSFVAALQQEGIIGNEVIHATGGLIPVGGLVEKLCSGRVLLVGDAAGMAHPITGAGVSNGVLSGRLAGEVAGRVALEGDLEKLNEFEEECRLVLGEPLTRAREKRREMEAHWHSPGKEWLQVLRSSWIAFEEYWR